MSLTIEPQGGTLSRKHIKGFAGGIVHQFSLSAEYFAWLAYHYRLPEVTIDLLTLQIEPEVFNVERNRNLAGICQQTLVRNFKQLVHPGTIESAVLRATFGIEDFQAEGRTAAVGASVFTFILADEWGREWHAELMEERVLVDSRESSTFARDQQSQQEREMLLLAALRQKREAFERILRKLSNIRELPERFFYRSTCPVCGYPTLGERGNYDMCSLCAWEDEGEDDDCADLASGPNGGYSLAEARLNFVLFGSMYSPDDPASEQWMDKEVRRQCTTLMRMYESLLDISDGQELVAQVTIVKRLEHSLSGRR